MITWNLASRVATPSSAPSAGSGLAMAPSALGYREARDVRCVLSGSLPKDVSALLCGASPWVLPVEINQASGAHFLGDDAAVLAPSSGKNRHRHAVEQASHRWRGGRRDGSANGRKILISTQVLLRIVLPGLRRDRGGRLAFTLLCGAGLSILRFHGARRARRVRKKSGLRRV